MQVFLEAIKFNHNLASASCDAFNIRRNETGVVAVPEWRRGISVKPKDSPAAYARDELNGNCPTIKVTFTRDDLTVKGIEIQALNLPETEYVPREDESYETIVSTVLPPPPRRNDVLGWIPPQPITFSENGEILNLRDSKISEAGVGVHVIQWQWQYRRDDKDSWHDIQETTHQIYTVLNLPHCPWVQKPYESKNTHLPWTDVLDYACHWAKGLANLDDVATSITQSVRDIEKVFHITYDQAAFYSDPNFDCSAFLELMKGRLSKGRKLNCSDCATVTSTFANILGCELWQSAMEGSTVTFETNPIRVFGQTCWRPKEFLAHEVAWKGQCSIGDNLFDATIELDGDAHPSMPPQRPLLPRNIPFGGFRDRQYLFRLVSPKYPGTVQPHPNSRVHRCIRPNPGDGTKPVSPRLLELIKTHYGYDKWPKAATSSRVFGTQEFIGKSLELAKNFPRAEIFVGPELVKTSNNPPAIQMLLRSRLEQHIRIDIDFCASADESRDFLLQRLGRFESATLRQRPEIGIGEIAFVEPESGTILFVRNNLVALVRNADTRVVDLTDFGRGLDLFFRQLLG